MAAFADRAAGQHHAPLRAGVLMLVAALVWTAHDTVIKLVASRYGTAEILFFGRALSLPLAFLIAVRGGGLRRLTTSRPLHHVLRSVLSVLDMLCFVGAIALAPLADVFTISFVSPLVMMVMAALLLGERAPPARWIAVGAGFLGVVVVMQPGGAGYGTSSLLALLSAVAYAGFLILSRDMTRTESVPSLVFWNSLAVLVVMAVLMAPTWRTPTGNDIWLFLLIAATGAAGQLLTTEAFRLAEASLLAPLQYLSLLWAVLFGYVFFGDLPTLTLWIGAAIIVAAAVYVIRDEARPRRSG